MWKRLENLILEIFFPAECFFCKEPRTFLCEDCISLLDIAQNHRPDNTGKYIDDIYAAGSYGNKYLKRLIMALKYEPFHKSLAKPLAKIIADHFSLSQTTPDRTAIIVPVPLASKRLRWRGYNQAHIIAQELGSIWQIPVCAGILTRNRETEDQAKLEAAQRHKNVKAAFNCASESEIKKKTIYLVDDVVTTGATMDECAKTLKRHGAAKVIGLAIARAER